MAFSKIINKYSNKRDHYINPTSKLRLKSNYTSPIRKSKDIYKVAEHSQLYLIIAEITSLCTKLLS
jgi:hypothetical protein